MKKFKSKLTKVTLLTIVLSIIMYSNVFSAGTSQELVGSGSTSGYVWCWNSAAGNGTTVYAEANTQFSSRGTAVQVLKLALK